MRVRRVRVYVLGRCELHYDAVLRHLREGGFFVTTGFNRRPDAIVDLRHPMCWMDAPRGECFPPVVVVAQPMGACSEDDAFRFGAAAYVRSIESVAEAVRAATSRWRMALAA